MTIVLLETIHPDAEALLAAHDQVVLAESPADLGTRIPYSDIVAILTRGRGQIRRPLLEACPNLRVVARCGVGLDNIDVTVAQERGIAVERAPGSTTIAVAEHTILLMLALARRLDALSRAVKAGNWAVRNAYEGHDLYGKTLGIVGMGAIGQRVAALATAFGMEICYWNRTPRTLPYRQVELPTLLQQADVVSLHCALAPATNHLLGERELALLKSTAFLINTARGALIDPVALRAALLAGRLAGFGADVLEQEPPDPTDPLLTHDRVLITPHTSALTAETYRAMCIQTAQNVLAVLTRA
ncbi:MAG: NAD(P)-dependent oxidoreductase [Caldilineaceae bacterium]